MSAAHPPNMTFESGRESMTMEDRRALLAAEVVQLQNGPLDPNYRRSSGLTYHQFARTPDAANVHDFNQMLGMAQAEATHGSKPARMSLVECRILAWKRGGAIELDKVNRLQTAVLWPRRGDRERLAESAARNIADAFRPEVL